MAQFRTELQANLFFRNPLFSLTGVQVLYFFFPECSHISPEFEHGKGLIIRYR